MGPSQAASFDPRLLRAQPCLPYAACLPLCLVLHVWRSYVANIVLKNAAVASALPATAALLSECLKKQCSYAWPQANVDAMCSLHHGTSFGKENVKLESEATVNAYCHPLGLQRLQRAGACLNR